MTNLNWNGVWVGKLVPGYLNQVEMLVEFKLHNDKTLFQI